MTEPTLREGAICLIFSLICVGILAYGQFFTPALP